MGSPVNTKNFKKRILSLEDGLSVYAEYKEKYNNNALDRLLKNGVISNYEKCFEVAWRIIFCALKDYDDRNLEMLELEDVFRLAQRYGLIKDAKQWFACLHQLREGHVVYEERVANKIFALACDFVPEACFLLHRLEEHHAA